MDAFIWVVSFSVILGLSSFFVGVLPLSFNLSATHRTQLSTFGNGLLLGAALGVIIPEGIEAVAHDNKQVSYHQVGLSLIIGFVFMLVVEQYGTHSPIKHPASTKPQTIFQLTPGEEEALEYDLDNFGPPESSREDPARATPQESSSGNPFSNPFTLGLVIHSLADGLALGASAVRGDVEGKNLSVLVFLALIVHKSPTALALSTSLLSASLPRTEIRKHIAVFSLATPFGALFSFFLIGYLRTFTGNWTGIAMLLSGGSFLYVATVIQPIGSHSHDPIDLPQERLGKTRRLTLLIGGVLLPFLLASLIGHH